MPSTDCLHLSLSLLLTIAWGWIALELVGIGCSAVLSLYFSCRFSPNMALFYELSLSTRMVCMLKQMLMFVVLLTACRAIQNLKITFCALCMTVILHPGCDSSCLQAPGSCSFTSACHHPATLTPLQSHVALFLFHLFLVMGVFFFVRVIFTFILFISPRVANHTTFTLLRSL